MSYLFPVVFIRSNKVNVTYKMSWCSFKKKKSWQPTAHFIPCTCTVNYSGCTLCQVYKLSSVVSCNIHHVACLVHFLSGFFTFSGPFVQSDTSGWQNCTTLEKHEARKNVMLQCTTDQICLKMKIHLQSCPLLHGKLWKLFLLLWWNALP